MSKKKFLIIVGRSFVIEANDEDEANDIAVENHLGYEESLESIEEIT